MDTKSFNKLEFNKIIDMLALCAVSKGGKQLAHDLAPFNEIWDINEALEGTTDAVSCAVRYGTIPLGGLSDVSPSIKRAMFGGVLSAGELLKIGDLIRVVKKAKKYGTFEDRNESYATLSPLFQSLIVTDDLSADIERCIVTEFEISDNASAALRAIRRDIKVYNDRIKDSLNKIIHSQSYKTMLQDAVITTRNGRYCVPVKQEYKKAFDGLIHDQSSTGATYFIEPITVVNLNNSIKECEAKEKAEIEKILAALSASVSEDGETLLLNLESLTILDFMFAKAALSLKMKASCPVFNTEGRIDIKKGRHPLLDADKVVPTDIWLGGDFSTLLITGPNTGGKTVALKTIGLLTLMGQAGLHIPAFDNSQLSVFDSVYADIGDEQSIEQNLSTFSAHMSNIVKILSCVTEKSLVLFDELGAGTDPTEGAALAMSIISALHKRQIRTAVTTHYSELKVFAIETQGIENASCEFDVETLSPTYKLLIGIPGKSNAFSICKRLGMDESIINDAKQFISQENVRFEDVITELEITQKSIELERARAQDYKIEAQRLQQEVSKQKEKMRIQREKIIAEAKKEAYEITLKASAEADMLIKEMKKLMANQSAKKEMDEERKKLRDLLAETYESAHAVRKKGTRPNNLKEGDRVFILSFKQPGVALSPPDKNGTVKVMMGNMKIDININDLETDENTQEEKQTAGDYTKYNNVGKSLNISAELDLRGQTVDEALENTEKYLDDAYLSGLSTVTIIHGKGTGALRAAIHKMLKKNPHVTEYRLGTFGEGESGVTIATIKGLSNN